MNSRGVNEHRIQAPEVLIGDHWNDQITGIVEHVARLVNSHSGSVAVIVPDGLASGNAIVNSLMSKGIAVADEVREVRQPAISSQIQRLIAQFLAEDAPPEVFLHLVERICRSPDTFRQFRCSVFRTFDRLQDRATFKLIDDAQRERFSWLISLEKLLQPWPDCATWKELRQHWESLLHDLNGLLTTHADLIKGLKFDASDFEPLWHEIGQFFGDRKLPSKLFLQFIAELIAAPRREHHPESAHRYAQVVVTTVTRAQGASWDNVILTDCIHKNWSRPPSAGLHEDARIRLRERGFFLFTAADLRELDEERILQAAFHARRSLTLTRYEQDAAESKVPASDLIAFAEQLPKCKVKRYQSANRNALSEAGKRLAEIHVRRADPNAPFDEFFLTFYGFTARAWHPSELEMAIKAPATIAYRLMYHCEREVTRQFYRSASLTVGRVVHQLLQDAFGGKGEFLNIGLAISAEQKLVRTVLEKRIRKGVSELRTGLPSYDLWWDTILRKASLLASRILGELEAKLIPAFWFQAEGKYQAVRAGETNLRLEGRTDLIISDRSGLRDATVLVCDFKTSKEIAYFNLATGDGLQMLGYKLLVELNGAREVQVLFVQPGGARLIRFAGVEQLNQMSERLGRLQAELKFGRRPNQKFGRSEELPIATVPIDARVLDQKHSL
ncbi:MAG: PD-(D/E)XK nuclease family protein [Verrucomicrobia bacterium]|nr:PD-(D/E)XK nuclease family protein [Verrucomicrobiota bacterium]